MPDFKERLFLKLAPRWPNMAPRWSQDGPKIAQEGPKVNVRKHTDRAKNFLSLVQKIFWPTIFSEPGSENSSAYHCTFSWTPEAPRWPQTAPRWSQDGRKWPQDGPRMTILEPKITCKMAKMAPRTFNSVAGPVGED